MILGKVNADREAIVQLIVRGPSGLQEKIEAVVDTGFDGWRSLPAEFVRRLDLQWLRRGSAILADGSETVYDCFAGTVIWHRRRRQIPIDQVNTVPLIGMALLEGCTLQIVVTAGGKVTIKPLD
jgi:clan AA aspartic protease